MDANTLWRQCHDGYCHCDWRLQVYGCDETKILKGLYIGDAALSVLAGILAFLVLFYRLKYCNQTIFQIRTSSGFIRPMPIEAMLLFIGIFNVLRALQALILVTGVLDNVAFRSFAFEFPWAFGYAALASYVFGVAHTMCDNAKYVSWFHNALRIDLLCTTLIVLPFISNNIVSISAGVNALHGDEAKAQLFTRILYGFWTFYCGSLSLIFLISGSQLVRLLKQHLFFYKRDKQVLMNMKTGILKVRLVTLVGSLCLFIFALVVLIYAIYREPTFDIQPLHLTIGFAWSYDGCLASLLVELIVILNPRMTGSLGKLQFLGNSTDETTTMDDSRHTSITPLTLAMAKDERIGMSHFRLKQSSFYYMTPPSSRSFDESKQPLSSSAASSPQKERTIEDDLKQYNAVTRSAQVQARMPSNARRPSHTTEHTSPIVMTPFSTYY
ncbi:hypothetical protein BC940DRAFT_289676 [Gongronella butleri]|nr:hypothetical protein BC940DRAFT_289676 [Gongronella butleri]